MTATAFDRAVVGWPQGVPDWVQVLAEHCDRASQAKVAKKLGYSAATVSLVLAGSYAGDLSKVELAVRGAFLAAVVDCPVLGDIPANDCLSHQRASFAPTNHVRVALYRSCHGACAYASAKGGRDAE